jgi:hypothetical protein
MAMHSWQTALSMGLRKEVMMFFLPMGEEFICSRHEPAEKI